jgi:poly(beta-D-mannuronate) lyase
VFCGGRARRALSYGSRYSEDSKNRSEFDEDGDAEVTAALKPVDDFIADLAKQTDYLLASDKAEGEAVENLAEDQLSVSNCVVDRIHAWAEAKALSELGTPNANLSAPSRLGGIAFAYAVVRDRIEPDDRTAAIDLWLAEGAARTMSFFDNQAPKRASRNNLRAWAGLSVTRIGLTLGDQGMVDWGRASAELVACEANADGSLPNEMWRGKLALHYQLHAVAPLVVTAALLEDSKEVAPPVAEEQVLPLTESLEAVPPVAEEKVLPLTENPEAAPLAEEKPGLFASCDRAIPRIVEFAVAGLADPSIVEKLTGKPQSVGGPDDRPRDFEMAWAQAYLRFNEDPNLRALITEVEKLGNSKLGGDQRLLW